MRPLVTHGPSKGPCGAGICYQPAQGTQRGPRPRGPMVLLCFGPDQWTPTCHWNLAPEPELVPAAPQNLLPEHEAAPAVPQNLLAQPVAPEKLFSEPGPVPVAPHNLLWVPEPAPALPWNLLELELASVATWILLPEPDPAPGDPRGPWYELIKNNPGTALHVPLPHLCLSPGFPFP